MIFVLFPSIGNGYWAYDGVSMTSMEVKGEKMVVNCSSTHLTSFAVLVQVSGSTLTEPVSGGEPLHSELPILSKTF